MNTRRGQQGDSGRPLSGRLGGLLLTVVVLGSLGWALKTLWDPANLPISEVQIIGRFQHLDPARLQQRASAAVRGGFFSIDVEQVRAVLLVDPWIAQVSVRRVWPNRLLVRIREQQPVARWGDRGLLNAAGELFIPEQDTLPAALVSVDGPPGTERQVLGHLRELQTLLAGTGLKPDRLWLTPRRAWHLRLDNGIRVVVGRSDFKRRLRRLAGVYSPLLGQRATDIDTIDLRYTNGFAVGWKSGLAGKNGRSS